MIAKSATRISYENQGQYLTVTGICWKVDPEVEGTIKKEVRSSRWPMWPRLPLLMNRCLRKMSGRGVSYS